MVSIGSDGVLGVVFTAGERPRRSPTNVCALHTSMTLFVFHGLSCSSFVVDFFTRFGSHLIRECRR